jgi:SAM-dependent MidA family methyltransferase
MQEGIVLFIDYGLPRRQYYRVDRREGTLLCHFRHRFHDDPLILQSACRTSARGSISLP